MEYSITQAAAATGRSPDSVRRAIRAGKLEATKLDAGYLITTDALAAWAGRPLVSSADQAAELKAARATIEAQAADLETALDDLRKAKYQLDSAAELIEVQRDALTLARESATVLGATVAALNTRLEALPPGNTRRPWFRHRPNTKPPR